MSHLTAFGPIVWAKRVPTMRRRDGRPDTTAHHVLLALATYAKRDGSGARPGVDTLAEDTRLSAPYVVAALERIQGAGLISKAGDYNGTAVWTLHLDHVDSGPSVHETREQQRRATDAERQRRARKHRAGDHSTCAPDRECHGPADRDVTVSHTVTVTVPDAVTSRREQRDVTVPHAVSHGPTTVTLAGHTPCIPNELPIELPEELSPTPPVSDRDAEFAAFYSAYPRHVGRAAARKAWDKAVKDGADPAAILAGAQRFATERADQDPKFTPYPASWLNAGRWDDEPTTLRAVSGGYQPYRNPIDQSIYDEDLT